MKTIASNFYFKFRVKLRTVWRVLSIGYCRNYFRMIYLCALAYMSPIGNSDCFPIQHLPIRPFVGSTLCYL
jgi:hypothetical protein